MTEGKSGRIRLKRVYESPTEDDGTRVLVERLWPRGVSKQEAAVDLWLKVVAPSAELREWYAHEPARWDQFRRKYRAELDEEPEAVERLMDFAREGRLTLVLATKDVERSSAAVLRRYLAEKMNAETDA